MSHRPDLVVRNGTVIDGSGMPSYRADIGVKRDAAGSSFRLVDYQTRVL